MVLLVVLVAVEQGLHPEQQILEAVDQVVEAHHLLEMVVLV